MYSFSHDTNTRPIFFSFSFGDWASWGAPLKCACGMIHFFFRHFFTEFSFGIRDIGFVYVAISTHSNLFFLALRVLASIHTNYYYSKCWNKYYMTRYGKQTRRLKICCEREAERLSGWRRDWKKRNERERECESERDVMWVCVCVWRK